MTPLDFIASLEHGEAKAAALTVFNLMTPKWTEITDDPATWPPVGTWVLARRNIRRYQAMWGVDNKWHFHDLDKSVSLNSMTLPHWRPI